MHPPTHARIAHRSRGACLAALIVTACRGDAAPVTYPPTPADECAEGAASACLQAAEDARDHPQIIELAARACALDPAHLCGRAAAITLDAHDRTYAAEKTAWERSLGLLVSGCTAHDADACVRASRSLFHKGRCQAVAPLLEDACATEHPASCRELARAAILGCSSDTDADLGLAGERLARSCAAGDREACFLGGYLALHPSSRDPEAARAAFTAGCAGEVRCESVWLHEHDPASRDVDVLAMVRSGAAIVVDHVGQGSPVPYSEVTLSVLGPFDFGRLSIGAFGVAGGAAFDVTPGRLSFHATADYRIQTRWGIGDLVLISWSGPDPARTAATCESAYECKEGYCSFERGVCVRASAADCERLPACRERGICGWAEGRCVATEEGCRASEACANRGACELVRSYCAHSDGSRE
jgi:hypothetical protein